MDNDLEVKTLTGFNQLMGTPFTTIDMAMDRLSEQETLSMEKVREMMIRVQDNAYDLGYARAMGWL